MEFKNVVYGVNDRQLKQGLNPSYSAPTVGKSALLRHPPSPPVRLRDIEQAQQSQPVQPTKEYEENVKARSMPPHQLRRHLSEDSCSKDSGMGSYTPMYGKPLESDSSSHKLYHRGYSPDQNSAWFHHNLQHVQHSDVHKDLHNHKHKDYHKERGYAPDYESQNVYKKHDRQRSKSPKRCCAKKSCDCGKNDHDRRYRTYDASAYNGQAADINSHIHRQAHNRQDVVARRLAPEFQTERDASPASSNSSREHHAPLGLSMASSENLSIVSSQSRSRDDLDLSLEHETKCKSSSPRSEHRYPAVTTHHKTALTTQKMYKSTPDLTAKHLQQWQQQQQQQSHQRPPQYHRTHSDDGESRHHHTQQKSSQKNHRRKNSNRSENQTNKSDAVCALKEPLNSARLRPIRQKTRNAVVNIMSDGDVCLEFIKRKEGEERVVEVFRISPDGSSIQIYTPSGDKAGCQVTDKPPPPQEGGKGLKCFVFQDLPDKYWKRYQYAMRFVQLVRSKTPKVTLYTPTAKAMLMENSPDPDFEVTFFEGGKFSHSSEGTRIIRKDGTSLTLDGTTSVQHLAPEMQQLWNYVAECRQRCEDIEKLLTSIESTSCFSYFPVTLGRRPHNDHASVPSPADTHFDRKNYTTPKNRQSFGTEPSPASMRSFEGTIMSHTTFTGSCQSTTQVSAHSANSAHSHSPPGTVLSHQGSLTQQRSVISNHQGASTITNQAPIQNNAPIFNQTSVHNLPYHTTPSSSHSNLHTTLRNAMTPGVILPHQSPPSGHNQQHTTMTPSVTGLPAVLCRAFVPGIGWATQFANGEIAVNFNDGSELSIQSSPMLVKHTDPDGTLSRFRGSDQLPGSVRSKLARLPDVMSKLEMASSSDISPQLQ